MIPSPLNFPDILVATQSHGNLHVCQDLSDDLLYTSLATNYKPIHPWASDCGCMSRVNLRTARAEHTQDTLCTKSHRFHDVTSHPDARIQQDSQISITLSSLHFGRFAD